MVTKAKKPLLFENLLTLDELINDYLRGQYSKAAVRKWIYEGMPKDKIANRLWFDRNQVSQWLLDHKKG